MKLIGKIVKTTDNYPVLEVPVYESGLTYKTSVPVTPRFLREEVAKVYGGAPPTRGLFWEELARYFLDQDPSLTKNKLYGKLKSIEKQLKYCYWQAAVLEYGQDIVNLAKSANSSKLREMTLISENAEIRQLFLDRYWALGKIALEMVNHPLLETLPISTLDMFKGTYYARRNFRTEGTSLLAGPGGYTTPYLQGKDKLLTKEEQQLLLHMCGSIVARLLRNGLTFKRYLGYVPKEFRCRRDYACLTLDTEIYTLRLMKKGVSCKAINERQLEYKGPEHPYPRSWARFALMNQPVSMHILYKKKTTHEIAAIGSNFREFFPNKVWNKALAELAAEKAHFPIRDLDARVCRILLKTSGGPTWMATRLERIFTHTTTFPPLHAYVMKWKNELVRLLVLDPIIDELPYTDVNWDHTPEEIVREVARHRQEIAAARQKAKLEERMAKMENFKYEEHEVTINEVSFKRLSPIEWEDEGKEMHHCVGSYTESGLEGDYMVYHLEYDEKPYTLGIHTPGAASAYAFEDRNTYRFQQCYGKCNEYAPTEVTEACYELVAILNKEKGTQRMKAHFADALPEPAGNPMPDGFDVFGDW